MVPKSTKPRTHKPNDRPEETAVLLRKELRRRGMQDVEIDAAVRKKKRRRILVFNAVKSRHLVDMRPAMNKDAARNRAGNREAIPRASGQLCTVHFAAEQLKLHRKTILRFIREGRLPAMRVGKSYRIKRSDLEAFAGLPASAHSANESPTVTSIVDLPDIRPELARKWQSTVAAHLNTDRKKDSGLRADVIYAPDMMHLKIVVIGSPSDSVNLLSLIRVWMDQLKI